MKRALLALLDPWPFSYRPLITVLAIIAVAAILLFAAGSLHAQQWPILRITRAEPYLIEPTGICAPVAGRALPYGCSFDPSAYTFALVWIGVPPFRNAQIRVYTTSSFSPHVNDPYPFDQIGDYSQTFAVEQIPFRDAAGKAVPGWVMVPIEKRKRQRFNDDGTSEWVDDPNMCAIIYLSPPGCGLPACGAITALPRTDWSTVAQVGGGVRRRVVAQ